MSVLAVVLSAWLLLLSVYSLIWSITDETTGSVTARLVAATVLAVISAALVISPVLARRRGHRRGERGAVLVRRVAGTMLAVSLPIAMLFVLLSAPI